MARALNWRVPINASPATCTTCKAMVFSCSRIGVLQKRPGICHRVMWITFSRGWADPKYWAQVDLTDDRVLDAGAEPPR